MSPFEQLSLPLTLLLTEEQIKEAYEGEIAAKGTLEARNTLLHPHSRLEAWMAEMAIPQSKHSALPENILPLFTEISPEIEKVSALARKRASAQSVLAETLLTKQLFEKKATIDTLIEKVSALDAETLTAFSTIEKECSADLANLTLQSLKFLRKWRAELNQAYGKLF